MSWPIPVKALVLALIGISSLLAFNDLPHQRWQYFYEQRVYPRQQLPEGARLRAFREWQRIEGAARSGKLPGRAAGGGGTWKLIGAQPSLVFGTYVTSGRVNALAVDPRDNNRVYAGGANGGIWRTEDGGATWTPLTDDQPSLSTGAIALDPSQPDTVYVGTGEANFNFDAYTGAGILKSTDRGVTWTNIVGPFTRQRIAALAVDPNGGLNVLAASAGGLYRSADAGATWALVLAGTAISVFFDPVQPGLAWAALGNVDGRSYNGVYRSTDAGVTWKLASGLASGALPSGVGVGRIEVVNAPASPGTVYAAVANAYSDSGATLNGIYRTTDQGQHWTQLNAPDFCRPQCWYDLTLRPSPTDPNLIYAGGVRMIASTNGGASWRTLSSNGIGGAPHVDHHALAFTADGTALYDGNDGGVWNTTTPGAATPTWNNLNATLALTQYYPGLSVDPTNPSIALGGTQDNGTQLYRGMLQWTEVIDGDGGYTAIDPSLPQVAYGSYVDISLFRTFQLDFSDILNVTQGLNQDDRHLFISPYVMDPSNPLRMYYGTYRLYRTDDGGGLWRPVSPDLTNPPSASTTSPVYSISAIAVAPSDNQTVYTGSFSGAVYVTTDGGATWIDRSQGLPVRAVTHLLVDPLDPATIYVTFSGFAAGSAPGGHIYMSTNFGASWVNLSGNLPDLPVNDLVMDPDLIDTFYAATDLGVMFSSDAGQTWTPLGTRLPHTAVTSLVLQRSSRTLRAATHGRSVWDYDLGPGGGFPPLISAIDPSTKNVGDGDFTLTITGSNFGPGVHVWWNGADRQVLTATATTLTVAIPASDVANVGRAAVIVYTPARGAGPSLPVDFVIGPAPAISSGGLVSAAGSVSAGVAAPGSIMALYGANLTGSLSQAVAYPLPATLGQVTVTVGGIPAPLYFVSPGQIDFQVPFGIASTGSQAVRVSQGMQTSNTATLAINRVVPALFSTNQQGTGQGSIRIAGQATIAAPVGAFEDSRPAHAGEAIEIYCTGLGAVSPSAITGFAASSSVLSMTLIQPTVTIGGVSAQVIFSGLAPGAAGLYQVNAKIPAGVTPGDALPVVLTIGGVTSNTVTVAVE